MTGRVDGKVAIITGGGSGIGRATALAMAAEGAKVVVFDRNEEGVDETARMIEQAGGTAASLAGDVTKSADVKEMVEYAVRTFGKLDVLFNNAGVGGGVARIPDIEEDTWDFVMDVNVKGVWLGMKYGIPAMQANGGSIINTASVAGIRGTPNLGAYCASKHAVVGLTKTAALEWARYNIRVNVICPAFTLTPMVSGMFTRTAPERLTNQIPMRRLGEPEEIANTVLFLATDEARFMTGAVLPIDGGLMAG